MQASVPYVCLSNSKQLDRLVSSTISCGLQNDVIARHKAITATCWPQKHEELSSNIGGQRNFLTCGCSFPSDPPASRTHRPHFQNIWFRYVAAPASRPISYITSRAMEPLSGKIREISHNVWGLGGIWSRTVKRLWMCCAKFILCKPRERSFVFVRRREWNKDQSGSEKFTFPRDAYKMKLSCGRVHISKQLFNLSITEVVIRNLITGDEIILYVFVTFFFRLS